MNNNNVFETSWKQCFSEYKLLSQTLQQILRSCAAQHLIDKGNEEVGSSDTSHELFSMWKISDKNWSEVVINEVNNA